MFCKFVNISKPNVWLVICIPKNFNWTTLKMIFSIFRYFFAPSDSSFANSCISAKYCPILTNHTWMEILFIQLSDDVWFRGPGSYMCGVVKQAAGDPDAGQFHSFFHCMWNGGILCLITFERLFVCLWMYLCISLSSSPAVCCWRRMYYEAVWKLIGIFRCTSLIACVQQISQLRKVKPSKWFLDC